MQGSFNKNPHKPRYADTWDVETVLKYLKGLGKHGKLSHKDITLKLVMLMALVSACRKSELHKLNPALMTDKTDEVIFQHGRSDQIQATIEATYQCEIPEICRRPAAGCDLSV